MRSIRNIIIGLFLLVYGAPLIPAEAPSANLRNALNAARAKMKKLSGQQSKLQARCKDFAPPMQALTTSADNAQFLMERLEAIDGSVEKAESQCSNVTEVRNWMTSALAEAKSDYANGLNDIHQAMAGVQSCQSKAQAEKLRAGYESGQRSAGALSTKVQEAKVKAGALRAYVDLGDFRGAQVNVKGAAAIVANIEKHQATAVGSVAQIVSLVNSIEPQIAALNQGFHELEGSFNALYKSFPEDKAIEREVQKITGDDLGNLHEYSCLGVQLFDKGRFLKELDQVKVVTGRAQNLAHSFQGRPACDITPVDASAAEIASLQEKVSEEVAAAHSLPIAVDRCLAKAKFYDTVADNANEETAAVNGEKEMRANEQKDRQRADNGPGLRQQEIESEQRKAELREELARNEERIRAENAGANFDPSANTPPTYQTQKTYTPPPAYQPPPAYNPPPVYTPPSGFPDNTRRAQNNSAPDQPASPPVQSPMRKVFKKMEALTTLQRKCGQGTRASMRCHSKYELQIRALQDRDAPEHRAALAATDAEIDAQIAALGNGDQQPQRGVTSVPTRTQPKYDPHPEAASVPVRSNRESNPNMDDLRIR